MKSTSQAQARFLRKKRHERQCIRLSQFLIFLIFLAAWEFFTELGILNPFIFSSPSRVAGTFVRLWTGQNLGGHIAITLTETMVSFLLVILIGLLTAIFLWMFPSVAEVAEPYLVILNSLPKSALAPLLIVWLGANTRTIIFAGISVAIFGSVISIYTGFRQTDPDKLKLITTLGGGRPDALTKVVLPSSIPLILSVMKVNIGLCLVGVIIGEFIGARAGLGYLIIYGTQVFRLDWVIMSICVLCILAAVLYGALSSIEKICRSRQDS